MIKVIAWNVNSVKSRRERLLALLERHQPDVVCLQELKCVDDMFPMDDVRAAGYHAAVFGQKTYNGVAVLAKTQPEILARGFGDGNADDAARFLLVETNGIQVASCYIPNGQAVGTDKFAYKLEWLKRLRAFLEKNGQPTKPLLLGGDFNVALEDRDVHDPDAWRGQVLFSDAERNAVRDVLSFGLVDTFRLHHEEDGKYSWWDYRMLGFPKNRGLRIDYLFATTALAKRCTAASIDRDERKGASPSDHAPVIAEFSS